MMNFMRYLEERAVIDSLLELHPTSVMDTGMPVSDQKKLMNVGDGTRQVNFVTDATISRWGDKE